MPARGVRKQPKDTLAPAVVRPLPDEIQPTNEPPERRTSIIGLRGVNGATRHGETAALKKFLDDSTKAGAPVHEDDGVGCGAKVGSDDGKGSVSLKRSSVGSIGSNTSFDPDIPVAHDVLAKLYRAALSEKDKLTNENTVLKESVTKSQTIIREYFVLTSESMNMCKCLKQDIDTMSSNVGLLESARKKTQADLKKSEQTVETHVKTITTLTEQVRLLTAATATLNQENAQRATKRDACKNELDQLKKTHDVVKKELEQSNKDNVAANDKVKVWEDAHAILDLEFKKLKLENNLVKGERDSLEARLNARLKASASPAAAGKDGSLQAELDSLKVQHNDTVKMYDQLVLDHKKCQTDLKTEQDKLAGINQTHADALDAVKKTSDVLVKDMDLLKAAAKPREIELERLRAANATLHTNVTSLTTGATPEAVKFAVLEGEISKYLSKIAELEDSLLKSKTKASSYKTKMEFAKSNVVVLTTANNAFVVKFAEQTARITASDAELQTLRTQTSERWTEFNHLKDEVTRLTTINSRLSSDVTHLTSELKDSEGQTAIAQIEYNKVCARLKKLLPQQRGPPGPLG